jgi:hypothetical protein
MYSLVLFVVRSGGDPWFQKVTNQKNRRGWRRAKVSHRFESSISGRWPSRTLTSRAIAASLLTTAAEPYGRTLTSRAIAASLLTTAAEPARNFEDARRSSCDFAPLLL